MSDRSLFPAKNCPCGNPQKDSQRLYCDECIERMAGELVEAWESSK